MLGKEDYTLHGETKKGNKDPKDHNLQIPCFVQTKHQNPKDFQPTTKQRKEAGRYVQTHEEEEERKWWNKKPS